MIKGISRQIIEVTQTQNNYFERAWLVVKPEYLNVGADKLESEAGSYLKNLRPPHSMRNNKALLMRMISLLSAAIGGGVMTAAVFILGGF